MVWDALGKEKVAKWSSAPASILEGFTEIEGQKTFQNSVKSTILPNRPPHRLWGGMQDRRAIVLLDYRGAGLPPTFALSNHNWAAQLLTSFENMAANNVPFCSISCPASLPFEAGSPKAISQCSFVYPYPSVSALAAGNSDHGPRKTRTKTQTTPDSVFIGERRNSDHGLSFWGGETQTMVWVSGVFGVGVDEGALNFILKHLGQSAWQRALRFKRFCSELTHFQCRSVILPKETSEHLMFARESSWWQRVIHNPTTNPQEYLWCKQLLYRTEARFQSPKLCIILYGTSHDPFEAQYVCWS